MIQSVKVRNLSLSRDNVRKRSRDVMIEELAQTIAEQGLLNNLVATPLKKAGHYSVTAGGRRLRALQLLIEQGVLPADHQIPVLVLEPDADAAIDNTVSASLIENTQRVAMNPVDEFQAYRYLMKRGASAEEVGKRTGKTTRYVEQRLRLADLDETVREALGAGDITLAAAMAYAVTADTDRQRAVFEQMQNNYYGSTPDNIRRAILNGTIKGSDAKARYVGRDAYVAAGGRINADLFSDADCETWIDTDILDRLAQEKLEEAAAALSAEQGYAFVTPVVSTHVPYDLEQEYHAYYPTRRDPTDEERSRLAALEAEADDLVEKLESELVDGTADADAANDRLAAIEAEIDDITDGCTEIDPDIRAQLGTFVYISQDGETRVHSRYYSEKPVIDPNRPIAEKAGNGGEGEHGEADQGPKLSAILVDELATQRRQILAAHLASDPALALNLTLFLMAQAIVYRHSAFPTHSTLRAGHAAYPIFGFRDEGSLASDTIAEQLAALDVSWAGYDTACARFDAFCLLPEEARAAWIGYAIAETLEPTLNVADGSRANGFHDHLGRLLDIRVETWWRPTAQNYFGRVKKDVMLTALEEIGGPVLRARYKDAKKGELAKTCESLCSGNGIVEADVRENALAWLPDAMRFGGSEQPRSIRMSISDERGNADPDIDEDEFDDDPGENSAPEEAEDEDLPVDEAA